MQAGRSRISASSESLRKNLHLLEMDGMPVYRHAVRSFKQAIRELLDSERLSIDDIDLFIFHQANLRLLEKVAADHAIPRRKLATTIEKYGNTSSASIPITLHDAVVNGRIRKGSRTLLAAVGGGLTWASALYQW
jgi:3-oxoacyl-[acyl-carrier-protein] synthase-3